MIDVRATPEPVPSRAVRVTFFEDRAEVIRRASAEVGVGTQWVQVAGASPFVDDASVQAKATSNGRVLAARVRRRVILQSEKGREAIASLEEDERQARERETEAVRAIQRARVGRERVAVLFADWNRSLARVPLHTRSGEPRGTGETGGTGTGGTIHDWRDAYRALEGRLRELLDADAAATFAQQDARDDLGRASTRLAQARVKHPICEAFIEVQVEAEQAGAVGLEIGYRTPCALWRPEHVARLLVDSEAAKAGKLEITTWATVWQNTGEDWQGIEVSFSTARPARTASPPLLTADVLALQPKSEERRRIVHVEARDQAIAHSEKAVGARAIDEMPGVDDGGLPVAFSPGGAIALPSHGRPFRVEIGRVVLDALVARVLVPELAAVAHYRATATLTGKTPLLAGPVRMVRGAGMVGRARLNYVAPGEPFAVGFGLDDAVRLRRTEETKREQSAVLGTQKIEKTVRLYLSNLSDTRREAAITERIPVSEIGDVQISLLESEGFNHAAPDGFLTAEVALGPHETRELHIKHEVRAKSNVQM